MKKIFLTTIFLTLLLTLFLYQTYYGLSPAQKKVVDTIEDLFSGHPATMNASLENLDPTCDPQLCAQLRQTIEHLSIPAQKNKQKATANITVAVNQLTILGSEQQAIAHILVQFHIDQQRPVLLIVRKRSGQWKIDPQGYKRLLSTLFHDRRQPLSISSNQGTHQHKLIMEMNAYLYQKAQQTTAR